MLLLIVFGFLAGIVTILSPCILPVLPIVLSGSLTGGRKKPVGIVLGFILSFTFFTLFLTSIVKALKIDANVLRNISVIIIALFGASLILPIFQKLSEVFFSKLTRLVPQGAQHAGFWGGLLIGASLGLIWTPCVGPILASVITLAATSKVNSSAIFITLAYSIGTSIPMFVIMEGGRNLLQKVPWLTSNTSKIQKFFGFFMLITAMLIYFNLDRNFQTFILEKFPQYGTGLTNFENNQKVNNELKKLKENKKSTPLIEMFSPSAPEVIPGGRWYNLPNGKTSLTLQELRGKVVLIDFWTYTCINCIRTLPYLKAWHEKYQDKGLIIIGVHTPEFEFEKDPNNVQKAIDDFELTYPVIQDNDYATWNAYNNHYWPAKYFIDRNGKIRSTHFGEGAYDESERIIQNLLSETGTDVSNIKIENSGYSVYARTPETYLGYERIENFASPESILQNQQAKYTIPANLAKNYFAYFGNWMIGPQYANPQKDGVLLLNFEAKEVFLVMRPIKTTAKIKVMVDGKELGEFAGEDTKNGTVTVEKDRLYKLIKLDTPGNHLLRLEFLDDNAQIYAFTFG